MLVHEILIEANLHGLNNKEIEYFNKVVEWLKKALSIPQSVKIDIAFNPSIKFDSGQTGLTIPNPKNKNHIFMFVAPGLSNGERVMVIAHEFIHVEHLTSGKMDIDVVDGKYIIRWENEPVKNLKYSKSNPWEIDAHSRDHELGRRIISDIGNFI